MSYVQHTMYRTLDTMHCWRCRCCCPCRCRWHCRCRCRCCCFWLLLSDGWLVVACCWLLVAGCWLLLAACWLLGFGLLSLRSLSSLSLSLMSSFWSLLLLLSWLFLCFASLCFAQFVIVFSFVAFLIHVWLCSLAILYDTRGVRCTIYFSLPAKHYVLCTEHNVLQIM